MGSCTSTLSSSGSPTSYKIIIVGESAVGKSSVFLRYTKNQFDYSYKPSMSVTIGSVVKLLDGTLLTDSNGGHGVVQSNGLRNKKKQSQQAVVLSLWDLPGKDEVDLRKTYYKNVDAVIVVVELGAQLDTQAAARWKQDIISNLDATVAPTIPFLLLGNKQDRLSIEAQESAVKQLQGFALRNGFIAGVPVSASNGDGSVHKAVQILIEFLLKETYRQQKDITVFASDKVLSTLLEVHNLSLTGVKELDAVTAQCAKNLTTVEQQYDSFQKGVQRFRQMCVVADITSVSCSSIEQCVLALRSSVARDQAILKYKMEDGFPELYIDNDTSSPASVGEFSSVVATYRSQVYMNGKELFNNLSTVVKLLESCLEHIATQINDDDAAPELLESEREEMKIIQNNKHILELKQTSVNQWSSKVQGIIEKILASLLWEETDVA